MNLNDPELKTDQSAPVLVLIPFSNRIQLQDLSKLIRSFNKIHTKHNCKFFGLYSGLLPFKISDLYMIGFHGTYQFPLEEELLITKVFELMPVYKDSDDLSMDDLIRVHIIEIESMNILPFDLFVFLPMNNKAILYMEKNSHMDAAQIKKFKENSHYALYVRRSDIKAYQDLSREQILQVTKSPQYSALEKSREIGKRLSGLMSSFFEGDSYNEDEGQQLQHNLSAIVDELDAPSEDLMKFAAERMTMASHSQNVSTYCYLFGMAMGLTDGKSLRLGGLLHDIGITELPSDIQKNLPNNLTKDQLQKFRIHPLLGKAAIEKKKLAITPQALEMILFHHEHTDGSGFPSAKKGSEIPLYAKACAFANEFDKLTSIRPGCPQLSPREAILRIAGLNGMPELPIYDHVTHHKIVETFVTKKGDPKIDQAKVPSSQGVFGDPNTSAPTSVGKIAKLTLERLLKTETFKPPSFIPEMKFSTLDDQQNIETYSLQLATHFKQLFS